MKLNIKSLVQGAAVVALSLDSNYSLGQTRLNTSSLPRFKDYPVEVMKGAKASLKLSKKELSFRTRYLTLHQSSPNFAGHYAITQVGCGMQCVFLLAIDLKTGKPINLDVPSGEFWTDCSDEYRGSKREMIEKANYFKSDSRLYITIGNMLGNECGVRFLLETNGKMSLIREIHLKKSK